MTYCKTCGLELAPGLGRRCGSWLQENSLTKCEECDPAMWASFDYHRPIYKRRLPPSRRGKRRGSGVEWSKLKRRAHGT
jgi:RNase P subunit RPR2